MSLLSFSLNGSSVSATPEPAERLSKVLRDDLGMTGVKVGCDAGDCGACTILIDGEPVCSCMVPAKRAQDRSVETVESLADKGELSRLQRSFLHYGAAQCGICTPGMLISAAALLRDTPAPDEQGVKDALGGVLCRCTGYRKIIQAVMNAHSFDEPDVVNETGKAVGGRIQRLDGIPKVNGTDIFSADEAPAGSLVVRVVRCPHDRAAFTIGDIESYLAENPGLVQIFTASDIPGVNSFGVIPGFAEQPVFAEGSCRYRGEAIAAIAGEADVMDKLDLGTFPVTWERLPAVTTMKEATRDDAPQLFENRPGNILTGGRVQRGNLEEEFQEADFSVEGAFTTPYIEHAYIEPEAGFAIREGERIRIHACTQAPYMDRDDMAAIMGLDPEQVRIVPTSTGGGFGSKLDLSLQPFVAMAAWMTNRPARIVYTRPESMMSTTKRHPSDIQIKIAASADGTLKALDFTGDFNTGAYASWGPTVANRVPVHASGPYVYPAYRAISRAIHTNGPPSGAFRGFGVPQTTLAQEVMFDELADKIGMDRLDFRINNALENGQPTVTGQVFEQGVGFKECLEALQSHWNRAREDAQKHNASSNDKRRGVGIAGMWYGCGNTSLPNPSTLKVGIKNDGAVVLFQGAVDIGQGANTVMAQICADAVGLPVSMFELVLGDTDLTPDAGKTSASRQTLVSGKASYLAGCDLRQKILRLSNAAENADIQIKGTTLIIDETKIDLGSMECDSEGFVLMGEGTFDPPTSPLDENGQGVPYASFGYGAHMVELEVDTVLGLIKVLKVTCAHDVGRAINPTLLEGQVEGGVAQGLGFALMEEYHVGRTENLHDYLIPSIGDVPEVETILIEEADAHGPYGAKGIGEQALIPTAPALVNAIRDATGARLRQLPVTPERVLAAIRKTS